MNEHEVVYFNNCRGRDHSAHFREGAFFDLGVSGSQAKLALNLPVGQDCVVASYADDDRDRVAFEWYALTEEVELPDKLYKNTLCRVFFGDLVSTETVAKSKAAHMKRYAAFFNVKEHFRHPSVIVGKVAGPHRPAKGRSKTAFYPDEVDDSDGPYIEGATRTVTINGYERSAKARTACLRHYGTCCCICGTDFGDTYGPEAQGYIHVHHLKSLSELKSSYEVKPIQDLRPVCPNCHAVLHLGEVVRSIEDVKKMLKSNRKKE